MRGMRAALLLEVLMLTASTAQAFLLSTGRGSISPSIALQGSYQEGESLIVTSQPLAGLSIAAEFSVIM